MKADEYATKKERLSWIGRTGKTVRNSIDGMDANGRNKGIVYEHLVLSRRVLKSFYRREFELSKEAEKIIRLIDDGEIDDAIAILRLLDDYEPRKAKPEEEIEIPEEVPAALPWDSPEGGK